MKLWKIENAQNVEVKRSVKYSVFLIMVHFIVKKHSCNAEIVRPVGANSHNSKTIYTLYAYSVL